MTLDVVCMWLSTPLGIAVTSWVALGLCTLVFKPRTPESYASLALRKPTFLFTRLAALLQLIGALGIDPAKVATALLKIMLGSFETVVAIKAPVIEKVPDTKPESKDRMNS